MLSFDQLGVSIDRRFSGQRIRINNVLDRQVIVHDMEIRESKIKSKDASIQQCVYIDLEVDGERRLLFGSYRYIIEQCTKIPKDSYPFSCTITNDHGYIMR